MNDRARWNGSRFRGDAGGHYESWFLRGNHPSRPLAFWLRFTIFSPRGRPAEAVGEIWAVIFDGESGRTRAARERVPMNRCAFGRGRLDVRVGAATLDDEGAEGSARDGATNIAFRLRMEGGGAPALLLPERLYRGPLPAAKTVVPRPSVRFWGRVDDGEGGFEVAGWPGSQNHNWGPRHTDRYAWGQVVGFAGAEDAFLECSTAQLRLGRYWTPPLTVAVLRLGDVTHSFTGLRRSLASRGQIEETTWSFEARRDGVTLQARLEAPPSRFVGLTYDDPPGGTRLCLNCKLASCELALARPGRPRLHLQTANRAALELVGHEVPGVVVAVR
ncbi:MAG: hypothetical protein MUF34_05075 [Polyangiaceae bacterium]|nr:hypothetical protein [Polyangiaceae bacterium]